MRQPELRPGSASLVTWAPQPLPVCVTAPKLLTFAASFVSHQPRQRLSSHYCPLQTRGTLGRRSSDPRTGTGDRGEPRL